MKIKHFIEMIKEYGILKCAGRVLYKCIYALIIPFYKLFLIKRTTVDPTKILFVSSPSFSDNAWFMYDYLHSVLNTTYSYIWLANYYDRTRQLKNRTKSVFQRTYYCPQRATLKSLKEIATSKYIFFTHDSPNSYIQPRKGQIVINLWHGCSLKDIEKNNIEQRIFDVGLVPGKVFIKTKAHFWRCDEQLIKPLGYPRYDCMLQDNDDSRQWIKELSDGKKVVIWMPTFRKTRKHRYPEENIQSEFDLPLLKNIAQIFELDRFCRDNSIFLCIKRHPFQLTYTAEKQNFSNIVFIDNNDFLDKDIELYSFLRYTDALISDYSSVAIDYLLLDKPIAYSLDDFEEYKNTRGFVVDNPLEFMPGHHMYNYEDLLCFLNDVADNKDPYKAQRQKLMPLVHNPCSNYCERVWQEVKDLEINR